MKPTLTEILCTRCGLCCDGSLFADVELAANEVSTFEAFGLDVEDDEEDGDGLLLQPCAALRGKRCVLYDHRPDCCRTFECRLLQEVKRGAVGVEQGQNRITEVLRQIERVNDLIARSGQSDERLPLKERCVEALESAGKNASDLEAVGERSELECAMNSVEKLIQETFLGGDLTSGKPCCSSKLRRSARS